MSRLNANKLPPKTDLDRLNELIEWYDRNKPDAWKRIQVTLGPKGLAKLLGIQPRNGADGKPLPFPLEQQHRGRTIVATGKD